MKNLELLPISQEQKDRIQFEALQYRKFARIYIEIAKVDGSEVFITVEQKELVNGLLLTKKELHERAVNVFADLPGITVRIAPVFFNREDIDSIDAEWLKNRLEKHNLRLRNLHTYTGIDSSTLTELGNGNKPFTKWHKVALYYFFKYYEMVK